MPFFHRSGAVKFPHELEDNDSSDGAEGAVELTTTATPQEKLKKSATSEEGTKTNDGGGEIPNQDTTSLALTLGEKAVLIEDDPTEERQTRKRKPGRPPKSSLKRSSRPCSTEQRGAEGELAAPGLNVEGFIHPDKGNTPAVSKDNELDKLAAAITRNAPRKEIRRLRQSLDAFLKSSKTSKKRSGPASDDSSSESSDQEVNGRLQPKHVLSGATGPSKKNALHASKGKGTAKKGRKKTPSTSSDTESTVDNRFRSEDSSCSESDSESRNSDSSSDTKGTEMVKFSVGRVSANDLPELPRSFRSAFSQCKGYVPLTVFVMEFLVEQRTLMSLVSTSARNAKAIARSGAEIEHTLQYGQALSALDLMIRYAGENYELFQLAAFLTKHKSIVSDMKTKYNCWTLALRYDIAVRNTIFRWRPKKSKVIIPEGLVKSLEKRAYSETERAGDLGYPENPYAAGMPKWGFDFVTGKPKVAQDWRHETQSPSFQTQQSDTTRPSRPYRGKNRSSRFDREGGQRRWSNRPFHQKHSQPFFGHNSQTATVNYGYYQPPYQQPAVNSQPYSYQNQAYYAPLQSNHAQYGPARAEITYHGAGQPNAGQNKKGKDPAGPSSQTSAR